MRQELFFRHGLLSTGWVENLRIEVSGGVITALETGVSAHGDMLHEVALPGMPNLHSHSFQRAFAGLAERRGDSDDNFWGWREMMYRFALGLTPDEVEIVATQAFIEMLEGGFSAVAEFHYLHHAPDGTPYDNIGEMAARIGAAAATTGIDLLLLPVFYAHAGFGATPPAFEQRRFINSLDDYNKIHEICRGIGPTGVAPHSLRAVSPPELAELVILAGDAPLHIHIAEQTAEVADCEAWCGQRPVEYLLANAPVGPNWCLVHATHVNARELGGIQASGAVVGLCPITEANLGDGIFPAERFAGKYGIGSDSNVLISAAQELQMLEYSQRLGLRRRNVMATSQMKSTALAMFCNAVAGGAQALGVSAGLSLGAPANIMSLPGDAPELALAQFVCAARTPGVRNLWVRGRHCVQDGHHAMAEASRARFEFVVKKHSA